MANLIAASKEDSSKYGDKGKLADQGTHFCVMDVELTNGQFGERWELQISPEASDTLKTISFTRTANRDSLFQSMLNDLPQHDCWLVRWTSRNGAKSGYDLEQSSDNGPCPCSPERTSSAGTDTFEPAEEEEDTLPEVVPTTEMTLSEALDMQKPSPAQLKSVATLKELLGITSGYEQPLSFHQAQNMIRTLRSELAARPIEE